MAYFTTEMAIEAIQKYGFYTRIFEFDLDKESEELNKAMVKDNIQVLFWYVNPNTQAVTAFLK